MEYNITFFSFPTPRKNFTKKCLNFLMRITLKKYFTVFDNCHPQLHLFSNKNYLVCPIFQEKIKPGYSKPPVIKHFGSGCIFFSLKISRLPQRSGINLKRSDSLEKDGEGGGVEKCINKKA